MEFELGKIVFTRGINERLSDATFARFVTDSMIRYVYNDWGDLCKEDKAMNDSAVKNGDDRILAKYNDIYIITEWDRSVTTILLCDEY